MRNTELGKDFWTRIDRLLEVRRMKQTDLARLIGISDGTLSSAKHKNALPISDTGVRIATALGTSLEYLVFGNEDTDDEELEEAFSVIRKSGPSSEIAKQLPFLNLDQSRVILSMLNSWNVRLDSSEKV